MRRPHKRRQEAGVQEVRVTGEEEGPESPETRAVPDQQEVGALQPGSHGRPVRELGVPRWVPGTLVGRGVEPPDTLRASTTPHPTAPPVSCPYVGSPALSACGGWGQWGTSGVTTDRPRRTGGLLDSPGSERKGPDYSRRLSASTCPSRPLPPGLLEGVEGAPEIEGVGVGPVGTCGSVPRRGVWVSGLRVPVDPFPATGCDPRPLGLPVPTPTSRPGVRPRPPRRPGPPPPSARAGRRRHWDRM